MDDTNEQENGNNGVAIPATAAVAGLVGGAYGGAYAFAPGKDSIKNDINTKTTARIELKGKLDAKVKEIEGAAGNATLKTAFEEAKDWHLAKEDAHATALFEGLESAAEKLEVEKQHKIAVAFEESGLKYVKGLPESPAKNYWIARREARLEELKKFDLTKLTKENTAEELMKVATAASDKVKDEWVKGNKMPANLSEFAKEHSGKIGIVGFDGAKTHLDADALKTINESEAVKKTTADLAEAVKERAKHEAPWEEKLKGAAKEKAAYESAAKEVTQLEKTKAILEKENSFGNVLKRPWTLLKEAPTKTKAFIAVSGVLLGAVLYGMARMMGNNKQADSFTAREDNRAATPAAEAGRS